MLTSSVAVAVTARPHHTVSQSEAGFEKVMQAVEILLSWPLKEGAAIEIGLEIVPGLGAA